MGRRTEGVNLCVRSGRVLSETAGAQSHWAMRLISKTPIRVEEASIDGEDRVFNPSGGFPVRKMRFEPSVRRWARPTPGTGASRRGARFERNRAARHVQQAGFPEVRRPETSTRG